MGTSLSVFIFYGMIGVFIACLFVIIMAFCQLGTSTNDIQEAVRLLKNLVEAIG